MKRISPPSSPASGVIPASWQSSVDPSILRRPENKRRLLKLIDDAIANSLAQQDAIAAERQKQESEARFIAEQGTRASHDEEMARCAVDRAHWIRQWVWSYDPRIVGRPDKNGKVQDGYTPFIPWPEQLAMLDWLDERYAMQEQGAIAKSRDTGASYLCLIWSLHKWLFTPGFKATFGSREEGLVDTLGNPDSLFEKLRKVRTRLPDWMLPAGFDPRRHEIKMLMVNPANGASITGEGGEQMGRGGRSSVTFVDEAAFVKDPGSAESAIVGSTDCVIWVSTVNRQGDFFDQKRLQQLLPRQVIQLHWRSDPRKNDAWAAEKKRQYVDPTGFAREYDIDSSASVEGICIPAKWVQAAMRLFDLIPTLEPGPIGIVGGDVGGGKANSVAIARFGPVVLKPERWGDPDTTETAYRMLDYCLEHAAGTLNFDTVGIGEGVKSTLARTDMERYAGILCHPINVGAPATANRVWPDGRRSPDVFANLKAELWWLARCAFERTYEHVLWMESAGGKKKRLGKQHNLSDLIALPRDLQLAMQLSLPKALRDEKGKISIEKKSELAKRRIASPDDAEAFVLTFLESPDDAIAGVVFDEDVGKRKAWHIVAGNT